MLSPRRLLLAASINCAFCLPDSVRAALPRDNSPDSLCGSQSAVACLRPCLQQLVAYIAEQRHSGTSGKEVYGRFLRDFDLDLYRLGASKSSQEGVETRASLPRRAHCDLGGHAPVVVDAVAGERTALFPGGITQRAAPDFASVVSKLAGAANPEQVAASALRAQALQTGMARSAS